MAGAGGFEPPNADTKNQWLTACRRPNQERLFSAKVTKAQRPFLTFFDVFADTLYYKVNHIFISHWNRLHADSNQQTHR